MVTRTLKNNLNDWLNRSTLRCFHGSIDTVLKIYFRLCAERPWWPHRRPPEVSTMPAQKRELKRNYIGLVSDEDDERRATEMPEASRPMKDYLLGLLAAVLELRGQPR